MRDIRRYASLWMSTLLLLLTACSSDGDAGSQEPPVLTIYVYAPEHPLLIRAADISASAAESAIHSLQIWVFEAGTDHLVGYLAPSNLPTEEGVVYRMKVSKHFADAVTRPNVDVFVVANTESVGLSLSETTTHTALEEAVIGNAYFPPSKEVPGTGLPMSGVLRNQHVVGDNPILRLADMAKVQLTRAVSKVRFAFSQAGGDVLSIQKIQIDGNMIPEEEYLFLGTDGKNYHVGSSYVIAPIDLITTAINPVNACDNPAVYNYTSQGAQEYEDLIDQGVTAGHLTQSGPYYFRETDKKISGVITYTAGTAEERNVPFSTTVSGSFSRNHSWIVYAYYEGLSGMQIVTVDVTPWEETSDSHSVFNW